MRTKRLITLLSLILCLLMIVPCFASCSDPENGGETNQEGKSPETVEEYIALATEAFGKENYKMLETTYRNGTVGDKTVSYNQGNSCAIFQSEEDEEPYIIITDNAIYNVYAKKKLPFSTADLESGLSELLGAIGVDEEWASSFKYKTVEKSTDANGNTVFTGNSLDESFSENPLIQSLQSLGAAAVDFESAKTTLIFDSRYRLIESRTTLSATIPIVGTMSFETVTIYEYGEKFAVKAPADADAYTTVTNINDFYM